MFFRNTPTSDYMMKTHRITVLTPQADTDTRAREDTNHTNQGMSHTTEEQLYQLYCTVHLAPAIGGYFIFYKISYFFK